VSAYEAHGGAVLRQRLVGGHEGDGRSANFVNCATGFPARAMTIVSPASASSTSLEKCVFAA
jgi:hypothetical protein